MLSDTDGDGREVALGRDPLGRLDFPTIPALPPSEMVLLIALALGFGVTRLNSLGRPR